VFSRERLVGDATTPGDSPIHAIFFSYLPLPTLVLKVPAAVTPPKVGYCVHAAKEKPTSYLITSNEHDECQLV
jgi:hypothetical protein